MRRWRLAPLAALGAAQLLPVPGAGGPGRGDLPHLPGDASCHVCHPGAVEGLRRSPHAGLLADPALRGSECTVCHGDLAGHAAAAARPGELAPVPVPRVAAASCARCHGDRELLPAQADHALDRAPPPRPLPPAAAADAGMLAALAAHEDSAALRWSGLLDVGYRFVHVAGSRDGYATDVDLWPGVRLRTFELRGDGGGRAPLDEFWFAAHDGGDPRWDVAARARDDDAFEIGGGYDSERWRYRASGDYHRVDRRSGEAAADFRVELGSDVRLFGSFARRSEDGFWLTERIGNRNVSLQSFVTGVSQPSRLDVDDAELGLAGDGESWHWSVAVLWRDQRARDRWSYTQPAPANPAFPESEDFTSRTSLRGPGARVLLGGEVAPWTFDATVTWYGHEHRIVGDGTGSGFDLAQFTSTTEAEGGGDTHTWLAEFGAVCRLQEELALVVDLYWRDHVEDLHLQQVDQRVYPTLGTTITVPTVVDQHTSQRLFEATAMLEWSPSSALDLGAGYGVAHEWLRVPELAPPDPRDFTAGYARDQGVLADLRWRPLADWTLRAGVRDFGQDGVELHELAPLRAREASGSLEVRRGGRWAGVFVRHRRNENEVSRHHLESLATGLDAGLGDERRSLAATYTFARVDSRTLTNFYFDPDPAPVPTFVGFDGDTHTVAGTLRLWPSTGVEWELGAAWTKTTGSFDQSLLDWRSDLRWGWLPSAGQLGVEFRQMRYRDERGADDWRAELVFVYWRARW